MNHLPTLARCAALLALLLLPLAAGRAEDPPPAAPPPDHRATWERLQGLAGIWTGRMEDPRNGPPVTVRYVVASNGHALLEFQNPGQSFEMVTVYYLDRGELRATHYCAAGNQPAFRLGAASTAELAVLEFDGGTGFDPAADGHVHGGDIRFVAPDRIEHRWHHYVGPKQLGTTHWFLQREPVAAELE